MRFRIKNNIQDILDIENRKYFFASKLNFDIQSNNIKKLEGGTIQRRLNDLQNPETTEGIRLEVNIVQALASGINSNTEVDLLILEQKSSHLEH